MFRNRTLQWQRHTQLLEEKSQLIEHLPGINSSAEKKVLLDCLLAWAFCFEIQKDSELKFKDINCWIHKKICHKVLNCFYLCFVFLFQLEFVFWTFLALSFPLWLGLKSRGVCGSVWGGFKFISSLIGFTTGIMFELNSWSKHVIFL